MTTTPTIATKPMAAGIGIANVARSEWTKLRSVRSTMWMGILALVAAIGAGALVCTQVVSAVHAGRGGLASFDGRLTSLDGLYVAQVAFGILGILTIGSEYATGMIRASLCAVPQRRAMLAAKGAVFGVATFLAGELLSFSAFVIGQAILHDVHRGASLGTATSLRVAFGGGLYLTAVGLLGFGLGALIRHTAGALTSFFAVLFGSTLALDVLPARWHHDVVPYMPANAGTQIITAIRVDNALAPWAGIGVLFCYVAVILAGAFWLITRRDA